MKIITYNHLWSYFKTQHEAIGYKNLKVYQSNLKIFFEFFGKTLESPVDSELYDDDKIDLYFGWAKTNYNEASLPGLKAKLKKIKQAYLLLSIEQDVPDNSFGATLAYMIERCGLSVPALAEEIGVPFVTVYRWIGGTSTPNGEHLVKVERLERRFGLPIGSLRKKLGKYVHGTKSVVDQITGKTNYAKDISRLQKQTYALTIDNWPEKLRADFEELKSFYTTPILPEKFQWFNRRWDQRWSEDEHGCNSANRVQQLFERFFGYLTLSKDSPEPAKRGLGMPTDQLSLVLILSPELLLGNMRFRAIRHDGKITTGCEDFLKTARSLLADKFGYLRQRPDLGREYLLPAPGGTFTKLYCGESQVEWQARWKTICDENLDRVDTLLQSTEFVPFRDIKEPLRPFLNSGDIYGEISTIFRTMRMEAEIKSFTIGEQAVRYRDFILVLFHYLLVLRSEHYAYMQLGKHLIQEAPNQWVLKIYKKELKRPDILDEDELVVAFPADVCRWITEYVEKYRPQLSNSASDSFFLASKNSNAHSKMHSWLTKESISRIFRHNMARYSPCSCGFGSHGVRKIVSSILDRKREIIDFVDSGMVAMNSPSVNQKHYTCGQVETAFQNYFRKLQVKGVLDLPPAMAQAKLKLEDENEQLKRENELLKRERDLLLAGNGLKPAA